MKITILQGAFFPVPPILGGAVEKIWFRMGQEFAKVGHDVVHISRAHPDLPDAEIIAGVQHLRVRGYDTPASLLKLKWLDLLYTRRACRQVPPDSEVVVTNTFWAPVLLPKKLKSRAYVDVQRMPKGQMRWYRHARLRANSSPVAAAIRKELTPADDQRVVMIPNPLPFVTEEPLATMSKEPRLLYVGRVHPEKGLHLLLQALRGLNSPWPLRIVGPWQTGQGGGGEAYRAELLRLAEGLPVTWVGPVHDPQALNQEYRAATIFIYPSVAERGETFGSAPLEAMAWGCVPVVSDLACFKDFIQAGVNGMSFDHRHPEAVQQLAAVLGRLMSDANDCRQLAQAAIQVRTTHSPERIARSFLADFAALPTI